MLIRPGTGESPSLVDVHGELAPSDHTMLDSTVLSRENRLPLVSVVIVTHNRIHQLVRLLDSIESNSYRRHETIVVNDASADQTGRTIAERYPQIKLVNNITPLYLSACRNKGIEVSSGELLLILDDDNVLMKNTLEELVSTMVLHPELGMLGGITCYLSNPQVIWCTGVRRNPVTSTSIYVAHNKPNTTLLKGLIRFVDFPNAFMIRRSTLETLGYFDEKAFPSHLAEADLGERIRRAGLEVAMQPSATFLHDIPQYSTIRAFQRYVTRPWTAYEWERNRVIFRRRYSRRISFLTFLLAIEPLFVLSFVITTISSPARLEEKRQALSRMVHGLSDALTRTYGTKPKLRI